MLSTMSLSQLSIPRKGRNNYRPENGNRNAAPEKKTAHKHTNIR